MWKDPIVEEIRAIREQIAREHDYDLKRIVEYLRRKQAAHSGRVVRLDHLAAKEMARQPVEDHRDEADA